MGAETGHPKGWRNYWIPEHDLPGFRTAMMEFYDECSALVEPIVRALGVGMGLQNPEELVEMFGKTTNHLRLLHYPAHPASSFEQGERERLGAHRDISALTLLFQDDVGGLQVGTPGREDEDGGFVDVPAVEGAVVVSIGIPFHRWTNDQIKAAQHRVALPPLADRISGPERMTRERFSIPFFADPHPLTILRTFPEFITEEHTEKYEPVGLHDFYQEYLAQYYNNRS